MRRIRLRPDDQLYFLHIPKTAGTSLLNILYEYYRGEERRHYHANQLLNLPASLAAQGLIVGHTFYTMQHYLARPPVCVTMLRDPTAQVISQFRHMQRDPNHDFHDRVRAMTLTDYLRDPEFERFTTNFQTLNLAVDADPRVFAKRLTPEQLKFPGLAKWMLASLDDLTELELLAKVQARLQAFAFVGVSERFDEAVELLTYTFHWPPSSRSLSLNRDPDPLTEIPHEARALIAERTQLDQQIYQFALGLLETRRREMLADLLEGDYERGSMEDRAESMPPVAMPPGSEIYKNDVRGWDDGWVGTRWLLSGMALPLQMTRLTITGWTNVEYFSLPLRLTICRGGTCIHEVEVTQSGSFSFSVPLTGAPIEIRANQYFIPAQVGLNNDPRPLSWALLEMHLSR